VPAPRAPGAFQKAAVQTTMEATMETAILACVVAKPISFPEDIEILYPCLDERQAFTGKSFSGAHLLLG